ncbi:hypothetical protein MSG28_003395 [Choristoneura fumiferana]|uniref:Uncharacterized protein n=1 Tax=Choristoneura fumiferana TaxID=7141 RepID=A0ACC0KEN3_CHOFU|nr:hypothetical protein MSG28_003395 [Choristoneura fumiferana]
MAHDIMSQFYTCLNYPLHEKLRALTNIIDQSSPNKDLQALFPQLINNIFASSFSNGWGLRTVTGDLNRYEYELLISFLEPQGPMFRLCYKLLSDPQLKYNLPLNALPHTPSLLIIPDLPGISNQHTPTQNQSRNEVWRSETVLQVFIDIWMSVEQFNARSVEMYQRNYAIANSSPERVRTVRVLVKHIHSFSAKHLSDPESRSSTLRKYARQIMCARAYHYIKHLVTTWPLDASFRLVMELWLSLIQPWRYTNNTINQDRFPYTNNNQEEGSGTSLDASFMQFIAENYPAYTCIFQLVLPRFTMLDLTSFKNAVMLFRLGKVFSQQHLVPILKDLEKAIILNNSSFYSSPDTKLNLSTNFEYEPIWGENNKQKSEEFVKKIISAKLGSEKNIEQLSKKIHQQHQGFWAGIKHWLMLGGSIEDEQALEESKKVPTYLNASIHFFADIFGLQEASLQPLEPVAEDISEHSSFANSIQFPLSITNKYQDEFPNLWNRNDFWGHGFRP